VSALHYLAGDWVLEGFQTVASVIEICDKKSREDAVAFVDDTLLLAHGKNLEITNTKVKAMI